jgi:hypothetical protein
MGGRERGGLGKFLDGVRELVSPPEIKTPGALREKVAFFYGRVKEQLEFVGEKFYNQPSIDIEDWMNADLSNNFGAIEGHVKEYIQKEYRMYRVVERDWEQFQRDYRHIDCKIKDVPALLEAFMSKLEAAEQHGK